MPTRLSALNRDRTAFTALFSDEQRELPSHAGQQAIDRANARALQTALRARLEHNDGLTAVQKFARETGDRKRIQKADDQALALGVQRSLDPKNDTKKPIRPRIPNDEFAAHRGLIGDLRKRLLDQDMIIKKTMGTAITAHSFRCCSI